MLPATVEAGGRENQAAHEFSSNDGGKNSTGVASHSRHAGPAPCQRFMRRGNNPVPAAYEEHEPVAPGGALVPFFGGPESGGGKPGALASEAGGIGGKAASKQSGRQMVYGNLKLGNFDEEISGINLSKLFSVYGPQSAEGLRRRKKSKPEHQGTGIDGGKNSASPNRGPDGTIKDSEDLSGLHIQGDYRAVTRQ